MTLLLSPTGPAPAADSITLAALRHEIDLLDAEMLALFQRRLALAERVGRAKDAPSGPHLRLRPDREADLLRRVLCRAAPSNREAVEGLWREVIGWGLARQGELKVRVWAPVEPARAMDAARLRFGRAAAIRMERSPEAALEHAASGAGAAVLAVNAGEPWWRALARDAGLEVFDGLGGETPTALAVARVDPRALTGARQVIVDVGGGAGDGGGARRWGLDTCHGWSLYLTDAAEPSPGCVGRIS